MDSIPAKYKKLLTLAKGAAKYSYSPYSKFKVGAAVLTSRGKIFTGTNVENASYGLSLCAEQCAMTQAVSKGHRKITAIAIHASKSKQISPCGSCRQVLNEFGPDADVITSHRNGKGTIDKLSKLLHRGFNRSHLRK